jgi:Zn-dependent M28 family amino/carboxypeptidase
VFDAGRAWEHAVAQVELGPRPVGSEAGWATGDYIRDQLRAWGWQVDEQVFVFDGVRGRNLVGRKGSGPAVMLGAHYDTRPIADRDPDPAQRDRPILGANDGASGVAVLLELARVVDVEAAGRTVWLAFFDAEDRGGIEGWPYAVGAREMARELEELPEWVIVLDMVGDADQRFRPEAYSDPELQGALWDLAADLGYGPHFPSEARGPILDDHVPFLERGIPAVDVIDFEYPAWHTHADTLAQMRPESLGRVGRLMEVWLEEGGWKP